MISVKGKPRVNENTTVSKHVILIIGFCETNISLKLNLSTAIIIIFYISFITLTIYFYLYIQRSLFMEENSDGDR